MSVLGERGSAHLREDTSPAARALRGLVRRMVVRLASSGIWGLAGFRAAGEAFKAEVFQGLGLWAVPADNAVVEAVVLSVGADARTPIVVQLRDEKTRAAVAAALAADSTVLHNTVAGVYVLPDGSVEARTHGGAAKRLATLDDLQAHASWAETHVHPVPGGTSSAPSVGPPTPTGTVVLKGE